MSALLFMFLIYASVALTQDSRSTTEPYCYVQSPTDLSIFNLTTMQNDDIDSIVRINDFEHLRVHFCQPLSDPCNHTQDYAVCLNSNGKEIGVGKEPPKVAIEFGKIMFRYEGDQCNQTHNYTVDVEMKCNFSKKEKIGIDLDIVFSRDQCGFQMSIETFAACSKRKQTKCDLNDKTGYYNLSPLMNEASNYVTKVNPLYSVILNVCHSLIYGDHFHQCDHDTMVCLVDEVINEEPSYTSLGKINDDMRFSVNNGTVHLDLTSDSPCDRNDTGLKTMKTTIEFVCDKSATETIPEYISGYRTCHYIFRWLTPAACSEATLIMHSEYNNQPCKIRDILNGLYYDLSVLEGNVAFVNSPKKEAEYQFSICKPLQNSNCTKSGTGVCKYIKGKNIAVSKGQANANLKWRNGVIYLNYTDGIACGNNQRSYTLIIFKCSHIINTLVINDRYRCATMITWTSSIICKNMYDIKRLTDILDKDNLYNWTLLTRHHANYVVQDESNSTQYHLNVGIPLVEDQFTTCTKGTGVCKVVVDNEGRRISELNLGYQDPDTHVTKFAEVYLKYINGSICEEDSSKRISSEVRFICDIDTHAIRSNYALDHRFPTVEFFIRLLRLLQGTPTFKGYRKCKYYFEWKTSHACFFNLNEMSPGCSTENAYEIYNFTYLIKNSLFKVNMDESSGHFNARYCEDKNRCNGTFICDKWPNTGMASKTKLDFTKPLVAFKFADEAQCKIDIHYDAVINKWCELWDGIAESFFINEDECTFGIDWDKHITPCQLKENVTEGEKENNSANIPPTDSTNIPPTDTTNIPPKDSTNVPPTDTTNIPPTGATNIPPTDAANIPPKDRTNISPTDTANIPPRGGPYTPNRIYTTVSLAFILIIMLAIVVGLGIAILKWKKRRVVSTIDTRNPVVRYKLLGEGSEPAVDLNMDEQS